ncbi:MAG: Fic family protein [Eggerthellaceae bacterium]
MHYYLAHGSPRGSMHYRSRGFAREGENAAYLGRTYAPPTPVTIPDLMDDLFDYLAVSRIAPSVQAAIAHFQLQAIRPFKTAMDRTERVLSLALLHRAGVSAHLVPCIGFALASDYDAYTRKLMPYRFDEADSPNRSMWLCDWIDCCTNDLVYATGIVRAYMKRMSDIVASYRGRLGDVRTGSAVDVIVRELPGLPLIDTTIGMELTGKGFTAVSDTLKVLERDGVITYVGSARRSRLYAALDIIQAEQAILDAYLPRHDADGSVANL